MEVDYREFMETPTESSTVTNNGTYDVVELAELVVSIPVYSDLS